MSNFGNGISPSDLKPHQNISSLYSQIKRSSSSKCTSLVNAVLNRELYFNAICEVGAFSSCNNKVSGRARVRRATTAIEEFLEDISIRQHLSPINDCKESKEMDLMPALADLQPSILIDGTRTSTCASISCDQNYIATAHGDHTVKIFDLDTNELLRELSGHPRTVWAVKFNPSNANILASCCWGGEVRVWAVHAEEEEYNGYKCISYASPPRYERATNVHVNDPMMSADTWASNASRGTSTGDPINASDKNHERSGHAYIKNNSNRCKTHNIYSGIREKDTGRAGCLAILRLGNREVLSLDFSPCGSFLAICVTNELRMWQWKDAMPCDKHQGEEYLECNRVDHSGGALEPARAENGSPPHQERSMTSASLGWLDSQSGEKIKGLSPRVITHARNLRHVQFSRDGALLFVAAPDSPAPTLQARNSKDASISMNVNGTKAEAGGFVAGASTRGHLECQGVEPDDPSIPKHWFRHSLHQICNKSRGNRLLPDCYSMLQAKHGDAVLPLRSTRTAQKSVRVIVRLYAIPVEALGLWSYTGEEPMLASTSDKECSGSFDFVQSGMLALTERYSPWLDSYNTVLPEIAVYSGGGFDLSKCGNKLLCCAVMYSSPHGAVVPPCADETGEAAVACGRTHSAIDAHTTVDSSADLDLKDLSLALDRLRLRSRNATAAQLPQPPLRTTLAASTQLLPPLPQKQWRIVDSRAAELPYGTEKSFHICSVDISYLSDIVAQKQIGRACPVGSAADSFSTARHNGTLQVEERESFSGLGNNRHLIRSMSIVSTIAPNTAQCQCGTTRRSLQLAQQRTQTGQGEHFPCLRILARREISEENMVRLSSLRYGSSTAHRYVLAGYIRSVRAPHAGSSTTVSSLDSQVPASARARTSTQAAASSMRTPSASADGNRFSSDSVHPSPKTPATSYTLSAAAVCEILQDTGAMGDAPCADYVGPSSNEVLAVTAQMEPSQLLPLSVIESSDAINMALWHPLPGRGVFCAGMDGSLKYYHHSYPAHAV